MKIFIFIGAADNIRRNIVDEVNHHGIIDTLSWVSQSVADWTVPDVRHPKPVDVALNYYGQLTPNHVVGNKNYGHSSNHVKKSYGNRKRQTKYKSRDSIKNKLTRSQRPPLTAKRKPIISNKRRKNPSSYSFDHVLYKKTINQNEVVMPSHLYNFPSSRHDLSTGQSKIKDEPTIAEYVLGNIHKLGQKVFGH